MTTKAPQKNCLLRSRKAIRVGQFLLLWLLLFPFYINAQQIANYVSNGSFEITNNNCSGPAHLKTATFWTGIDSSSYGGTYISYCNSLAPLNNNTYQVPHNGKAYILSTHYWKNASRGYQKNRLKKQLQAGKKYCVKFHVNIANTSPIGVDAFGAYFGDAITIDTIKKYLIPLTYLSPQVKNPLGNVITDTLNWVPITGTFTANGAEKYLVLGNFLADNAITTATIGGPFFPGDWTDICIDDVSCIELDVAAYAGPDKNILAGQSTYLGREKDFAVDPYCYWYQLPGMLPLDTSSGITVSPTVTTTYVVRQELECNAVKWDTVVVNVGYTGLVSSSGVENDIRLFPNPADNILLVKDLETTDQKIIYSIYNHLGQMLRKEELLFEEHVAKINTTDLCNGAYFITISSVNGTVTKKLLIAK